LSTASLSAPSSTYRKFSATLSSSCYVYKHNFSHPAIPVASDVTVQIPPEFLLKAVRDILKEDANGMTISDELVATTAARQHVQHVSSNCCSTCS
jgi:hypothetical protein